MDNPVCASTNGDTANVDLGQIGPIYLLLSKNTAQAVIC
jgi:hypothetical protein